MNKYNAHPTVVDNVRFHSKAEARRYEELKRLLAYGVITDLHLQPRFKIHAAFRHNGEREHAIHYVADFEYVDEHGGVVVEDVKGKRTEVYKIKRKMFLARYGDVVEFVEVEA